MYKNIKILVLGMARSGYEVAKLLSKYNNTITVTDMKEQEEEKVKTLKDLNIPVVITNKPEELLDDSYDLLIKNPGIRKDHKCVLRAKKLNIKVINEMEVAYSFLPKNINIIGITGSNGKTTTTTIVYEILKNTDCTVHLGGNIGYPLSSLVSNISENDILVLEISDHQLVDMYNFKTNISVLTNLSEVHLDFHENYKTYKLVKKKIFNHHTKNDFSILNKENTDVLKLTEDIKSQKLYFSSKNKADCYIENKCIYYLDEKIINIKDLKVKGIHNLENIMAAILVAKTFNVDNYTIKKALSNFVGVEHRLEFVRRINSVEFYNDSKSTNVDSTIIAINSFEKSIILILGGLDRNHSFEPLKDYMDNVKLVVCYGETKNRIKNFCDSLNIKCEALDNLESAVKFSYNLSEEDDIILLSPACASWDQFKDFEERGKKYKEVIEKL